ncbi:MAG: citrate synthase [Myxococcota bacterium]
MRQVATTDSAPPIRGGLDGVVVADTQMSRVDGENGQLIIGGHEVGDLAGQHSFEAVCGLLWTGRMPTEQQRADIARSMAAGRITAYERLPALGDALDNRDSMAALRAAVAHWKPADAGAADGEPAANTDIASSVALNAELIGAVAVFAAAWWRQTTGQKPLTPDSQLGLAGDYLRMLRGQTPDPADARALDSYLVTVCDHGMNASTFAARVVTSTGSDVVSAVVAAIAALKGPLHGGAPGPVLDMLDAIGHADAAESWLDRELAAGRRIMGMGHRVYRVRDPRAAVLERAAETLIDERAHSAHDCHLDLARAVERIAQQRLQARHPERSLRANVEFYTAVLLDALGVDRRMFSPTFAVARTAGWCGHIAEQRQYGRLIRPKARYVGPLPAAAARGGTNDGIAYE